MSKGGWISWKEAADKDGEELLLEMINAIPPTLESRVHPKLPKKHQGPVPKKSTGASRYGGVLKQTFE